MILRIITAVILLPLIFFLITFSSKLLFSLFVSVVLIIALIEYLSIFKINSKVIMLFATLTGIIICTVSILNSDYIVNLSIVVFIFAVFIIEIFENIVNKSFNIKKSVDILFKVVFGLLYVCWFGVYVIKIYNLDKGRGLIVFLFCTVWVYDSAAYFTGRLLGKTHIFAPVSSGKTTEGTIGGIVVVLILAVILKYFDAFTFFSFKECVILTFILSILAQIGDLSESLLKRAADVKDSSRFLNAHGGFLDKLDSFVFASPFLYYYAVWFM